MSCVRDDAGKPLYVTCVAVPAPPPVGRSVDCYEVDDKCDLEGGGCAMPVSSALAPMSSSVRAPVAAAAPYMHPELMIGGGGGASTAAATAAAVASSSLAPPQAPGVYVMTRGDSLPFYGDGSGFPQVALAALSAGGSPGMEKREPLATLESGDGWLDAITADADSWLTDLLSNPTIAIDRL